MSHPKQYMSNYHLFMIHNSSITRKEDDFLGISTFEQRFHGLDFVSRLCVLLCGQMELTLHRANFAETLQNVVSFRRLGCKRELVYDV